MKDVQKLSILTKPELVNICKRNNLNVTGEKQALAARILRKVGKIFDDDEEESGCQEQPQNYWTKVLHLLLYITLFIPKMSHKALYDISVLVYVYVLLPKMKYCHKYIFSRRILTRLNHLPVFDDGVNYRALRVDIGRNVNVSVAAQVRGSPGLRPSPRGEWTFSWSCEGQNDFHSLCVSWASVPSFGRNL